MKLTNLVLFCFLFGCMSILVDYDSYPAAVLKPDPGKAIYKHIEINITMPKYIMHGNLYIIDNPLPYFHIFPPSAKGCGCREKTSDSSKAYGCILAMNGGFFHMTTGLTDYCIGNIVSDSKIVHYYGISDVENDEDYRRKVVKSDSSVAGQCNFGVDKNGNYITGFFDKDHVQSLGFTQLIGGVIWLVRNGTSYVAKSKEQEGATDYFVKLAAPRTGIGYTKDGKLMILVFNGSEAKLEGPDLNTFAQVFIDHGALGAVNLDGGGSSTVIEHGTILWPTGTERAVTTILCVK